MFGAYAFRNCTGQHTSWYFSILLLVEINQWNQYSKMLTFVTWYMIECNTKHLHISWGPAICRIVICTPWDLKTFDLGVPDLVTFHSTLPYFYGFWKTLPNLLLIDRVLTLDWVFAVILVVLAFFCHFCVFCLHKNFWGVKLLQYLFM